MLQQNSTKFGQNKLFYNWKARELPLEEIIESLNGRICQIQRDNEDETMSVSGTVGKHDRFIVTLLNAVEKLKDLLKQELKINPDDYEYITETKLIKIKKEKK